MRLTHWKYAVVPAALMLCAPQTLRGDESQAEKQGTRQQPQQGDEAQQDDEQSNQNASRDQAANRERQQSRRNASPSSSLVQTRQARRQYMAGFVRGYYSGFADGVNDYLIIVGKQGDSDSARQKQGNSRQRVEENRLRGKLRNDARTRESQHRSSDQSAQRQQASGVEKVSGEVISTKRVRLQNDNQQHMILLMENQQGQRRIIDAGPMRTVARLSILAGDQVTAQGRMRRTRDGIPVLNAQWIQASGERIAVQGQGSSRAQQSRR